MLRLMLMPIGCVGLLLSVLFGGANARVIKVKGAVSIDSHHKKHQQQGIERKLYTFGEEELNENLAVFARRGNSRRKCSGSRSRKGCVPTMSPFPSESPSAQPSVGPTVSMVPSFSLHPSSRPTLSMSPSVAPSVSPTGKPSASPSEYPTAPPTFSLAPSLSPTSTPSLRPSQSPTSKPSQSYSPTRSQSPSTSPTDSPSAAPSVSPAPTILVFDTTPVTPNDTDGQVADGVLSTCMNGGPANDTVIAENEVIFYYSMNIDQGLADVEIETVVGQVENRVHRLLAFRFLKCKFDDARRLEEKEQAWVSLSSLPTDVVATQKCLESWSVANKDCITVEAGFTPGYMPTTTFDDLLYNDLGPYLEANLPSAKTANARIDSITFRGFDTSAFSGETAGEDDRGSVAGVEQPPAITKKPAVAGGTVALALAAVGLLVVIALLVKKRRSRAYIEQEDEGSVSYSLDDDSSTNFSFDERAIILNDEDETNASVEVARLDSVPEGWVHDVRACQSSTCAVCRAQGGRMAPTFVSAEIQNDFGPSNSQLLILRSYMASNTVDL